MNLWGAWTAELMKLKRTLALWMVLVTPLVLHGLYFFLVIDLKKNLAAGGADVWRALFTNVWGMWCMIMLPLFVTLETTLLGNIEHGEKQWKHLFALPLPRGSVYAAKWLVGLLLNAAVSLVFIGAAALSGTLLRALLPEMGFSASIPWGWMCAKMGYTFLISMCMLSIHTWMGLRWRSFALSAGFGMLVTVVNIMVVNSDTWTKFFPWALVDALRGATPSPYLPAALAIGIGGGLLVALLGGWDVTRRDCE